jgi:hypothetical protein
MISIVRPFFIPHTQHHNGVPKHTSLFNTHKATPVVLVKQSGSETKNKNPQKRQKEKFPVLFTLFLIYPGHRSYTV